ncbi:MAG: hypothetical protein ACLQPN_11070 [Bryobacteraceae bacterium]
MTNRTPGLLRKSGLPLGAYLRHSLPLQAPDLGQSCPERCPHPEDAAPAMLTEPLGTPLSIREAAHLIGCSPWTVRQRYLPAGLPHHRLTQNGKLIFYRNQIIRWLLRQQQKRGITP